MALLTSGTSYMMPGTPHAVLTLEDSLAEGGHFYSGLQYKRTLYSILAEHFCGKYITNASHPRAPLLLFKTLMGLVAKMKYHSSGKFFASAKIDVC